MSDCADHYIWKESEIGTVISSCQCIQRRCGGTYTNGGQWEPVVFTCASDYFICALNTLEGLAKKAINDSEVSTCNHVYA